MVELRRKYTFCLRQKALEDGLLRFLRGETQRLQLQQLIPGDLADGGLMDQLGVRTVGGDGGDGLDVGLPHDDGVALHMAEALAVAHHHRVEHLTGGILRYRAGDDTALGPLAVELDGHVTFGGLGPVGQQALRHHHLAAGLASVMASIAGILFCSRIGIVTTSSGNGYEMTAVAACVLGGISLTGGVGSVIGSAIGAVIMSSISYLLVFMGFSSDYNDAITGSILIVIVVVDSVMQIRSRMKLRHERLQARTRDDMNTEEGDA